MPWWIRCAGLLLEYGETLHITAELVVAKITGSACKGKQMRKKPEGSTLAERSHKSNRIEGWLKSFLDIRPVLFRVVGKIVRPEDIEDIVQETFVMSYAASRSKKIENPRAYMMRTAQNIAFNANKRVDRKMHLSFEELLDGDFAEDEMAMPTDRVEDRYQSEEMFLYFCRAVAKLPVDCRRIFILKKVYGLSQDEIAARFGISTSTVEKHVAKGMAMTGRYMVAQGYWDESTLLSRNDVPAKEAHKS